uniref:Uncharacterized protein n=1 Tax=Anguilla anguilla TaxID=7936 RepID=A0A0E9UE70_ANGAN
MAQLPLEIILYFLR